jgi:hypothetical protein
MNIASEHNADYILIRPVATLKDENDLIPYAMVVVDECKKYEKKVVFDGLETEFPSDLFPYFDLVQF